MNIDEPITREDEIASRNMYKRERDKLLQELKDIIKEELETTWLAIFKDLEKNENEDEDEDESQDF